MGGVGETQSILMEQIKSLVVDSLPRSRLLPRLTWVTHWYHYLPRSVKESIPDIATKMTPIDQQERITHMG